MSTLLHIDSSVRAANNPNPDHDSISKNIALRFIDTWKQNRPEDEYIYRDVGRLSLQVSLQALKAFESAARRGSFKLAAEELSLTPTAISHQ